MGQSVADVIVETLVEAGARRCYGVPGDTLNHLTDSIRRSTLRFVHVRHEEAGGFAAGADAYLTGELALCAGSAGPGSLHFINGVLDAHRSHAPVVLIASQVTRDELGFDFPQEVDYKAVYSSCSVFCDEVRTPQSARRMTAYAAQAALSKRGLAVLIVPSDVAAAAAPSGPPFAVYRAKPRTLPSEAELKRIAETLNAARRIAIYGGSGCQGAHAQVRALAARLNSPVAFTSRAKEFLDYDNPYAVGMTGVFGVESGYHAVANCDVLLMLGADFAWRQFYPDSATIVQIDIEPLHLGRRHPAQIGVVGDIVSTIDALLPMIDEHPDDSFLTETLKIREKRSSLDGSTSGERIRSSAFAELVARHADVNGIWTADGGLPIVWLYRHVDATGQNRLLSSLVHGSMANALPQALGAAAAYPGRQVIALCGDGGLTMLLGDLITTLQERLPIKIAVMNNASLGFVELEQKTEGLLDTYTELENPDFSRVAAALGLWGRRVEKAEDAEGAVRAWLSEPGPALLDVLTDRFELFMPSHLEPSMVLGTALYSAKAILHGRGKDVTDLVGHNFTP